jgi:hypothetical protein
MNRYAEHGGGAPQSDFDFGPLGFGTARARNFWSFTCLRYIGREDVSKVIGNISPVSAQGTKHSILSAPHIPGGSLSPLLRVNFGFFMARILAAVCVAPMTKLDPEDRSGWRQSQALTSGVSADTFTAIASTPRSASSGECSARKLKLLEPIPMLPTHFFDCTGRARASPYLHFIAQQVAGPVWAEEQTSGLTVRTARLGRCSLHTGIAGAAASEK